MSSVKLSLRKLVTGRAWVQLIEIKCVCKSNYLVPTDDRPSQCHIFSFIIFLHHFLIRKKRSPLESQTWPKQFRGDCWNIRLLCDSSRGWVLQGRSPDNIQDNQRAWAFLRIHCSCNKTRSERKGTSRSKDTYSDVISVTSGLQSQSADRLSGSFITSECKGQNLCHSQSN